MLLAIGCVGRDFWWLDWVPASLMRLFLAFSDGSYELAGPNEHAGAKGHWEWKSLISPDGGVTA